ncbi:MAG: ThiF family adenylyltransferase, partial [Aeromonas veronii]
MLSDAASLNDEEYLRYGRQLMLAEVGEAGQARLKDKSVLIVGLGGLGSPLALY